MGRGGSKTIDLVDSSSTRSDKQPVEQQAVCYLPGNYTLGGNREQPPTLEVQSEYNENDSLQQRNFKTRQAWSKALTELFEDRGVAYGDDTDQQQVIDWFMQDRNYDWISTVSRMDDQTKIHCVEKGLVFENYPELNYTEDGNRVNKTIGDASNRSRAIYHKIRSDFKEEYNGFTTSSEWLRRNEQLKLDKHAQAELKDIIDNVDIIAELKKPWPKKLKINSR
jgi:hypothetical protein